MASAEPVQPRIAEILELRPVRESDAPTSEERLARDAALTVALQTGHPNAPAKLFDAYGRYIHRLLFRLLGDDSEVDDMLHEVFAQAFVKVDKLRDPQALRPWLARIAVCSARDLIRRRSRRRWLSFVGGDELDQVPDNDGGQKTFTRYAPPIACSKSSLRRNAFHSS